MAGRVRTLIDELIQLRSGGAPALEHFVKVSILLNGIDPDQFTKHSEDDQAKIALLEKMIRDYRSVR